jgi:hypothetical protein
LSLQLQLDALSSCLGDRLIAHLRDGHMSRMQACRRAAGQATTNSPSPKSGRSMRQPTPNPGA